MLHGRSQAARDQRRGAGALEAEGAESLYRRAIELQPDQPQARTGLATLLSETGRKEDAQSELERVLAVDPNNAKAISSLEKLVRTTSGVPLDLKSEAGLKEQLARRPGSASLHHALANLYFGQGSYALAFEQIREVTRLEPDNFVGWLKLGKLLEMNGQNTEALEVFQRVLGLRPGQPIALLELALLAGKTGDNEKALRLLDQASRHPDAPLEVWFNLGLKLSGVRRFREAREAFGKFLAGWRGNPRFRQRAEEHLARIDAALRSDRGPR
ncbi:MAG: tetratricopeptide repeat protein [Candidatus Riflebacteria bacterium]|nr:tetratricopeptide repeat protein [Candidatus Riflebacteria bacterium]